MKNNYSTYKEEFNNRISEMIAKGEKLPIGDLIMELASHHPSNMKIQFDMLLNANLISLEDYESGKKYWEFE